MESRRNRPFPPGAARRRWAPLSASLALLCAPSLAGASLEKEEYAIKAAFLYNFAKYTSWPAEAFTSQRSPLVVGVIGDDPFGSVLEEVLSEKRVGARPVQLVRPEETDELGRVHVLFVGRQTSSERAEALARLRGSPVLLVSDEEGFARRSGAIGFFLADRRVRFEINVESARDRGLEFSSELLKLARVVERPPRSTGVPGAVRAPALAACLELRPARRRALIADPPAVRS